MTPKEIMQKAVNIYGLQNQMIKTIEELAELAQVICKSLVRLNSSDKGFTLPEDLTAEINKSKNDYISEEIADVEIMLAQCKMMFQCETEVQEWKERKLARLKRRLTRPD